MKRALIAVFGAIGLLSLAGCADPGAIPDPGYTQSRAIDQDIDAARTPGLTPTSPSPAATVGGMQ